MNIVFFVQELIEQLLKERLDERAGRTVNAGDGNAEEVAVENKEGDKSEESLLDTGINEDAMNMSLPDCCLSDEEEDMEDDISVGSFIASTIAKSGSNARQFYEAVLQTPPGMDCNLPMLLAMGKLQSIPEGVCRTAS